MKREFSAGGIVIKKELGEVSALLINNAAMKDPKKSYWGFPKGHLEEKETSEEAALREVKEETGLDVKVIKKIGSSKYIFLNKGEKIFKVVTIFLMEYIGGEIKIQDKELLGADWFSLDEVLKNLSFSNDKKLFQQAMKFI